VGLPEPAAGSTRTAEDAVVAKGGENGVRCERIAHNRHDLAVRQITADVLARTGPTRAADAIDPAGSGFGRGGRVERVRATEPEPRTGSGSHTLGKRSCRRRSSR
jgi:hypothetical protein